MVTSLVRVQEAKDHAGADVVVHPAFGGPGGGPGGPGGPVQFQGAPPPATDADLAAVPAVLKAQPGTDRYYSVAETDVAVAGVTQTVNAFAFTGDASWAGYSLVTGRWFAGAGEAVAQTTFLTATGTKVGDTVTVTDHGKAVALRIVGEVFDPTDDLEVFTDAANLAPIEGRTEYYVKVTAGTDVTAYVTALSGALPTSLGADPADDRGSSDTIVILDSLSVLLTLLLVAVAGLGVLNMVVLQTRERVHDLGVLKALGMVPRQTVAMVVASVVLVGLAGGAAGAALGVGVHTLVVPAMGRSAGLRLPASVTGVFDPGLLVLLGFGGVVIAVLGALLPAGWAARTRTATALRTE
jgi:putative ABC transport system permease protein